MVFNQVCVITFFFSKCSTRDIGACDFSIFRLMDCALPTSVAQATVPRSHVHHACDHRRAKKLDVLPFLQRIDFLPDTLLSPRSWPTLRRVRWSSSTTKSLREPRTVEEHRRNQAEVWSTHLQTEIVSGSTVQDVPFERTTYNDSQSTELVACCAHGDV